MSILILIPVLGALLAFWGNRCLCLIIAVIEFLVSLLVAFNFDYGITGIQFHSRFLGLIPVGIDGLSLPFVLLTTILVPICIAVHKKEVGCFHFLILEAFLITFFASLDLLYFLVFFEGSLIPMFFIIGLWGSKNRIYAAFKILIYTLAGSIPFLASIAYIATLGNITNIEQLKIVLSVLDHETQSYLWWGMFISMAVKIPMVPLHTWLPDAHVQAPTSGSVLLAGILIKMAGYGMVRILLPLFPDASNQFADIVIYMSIIAVIYASLISLVQKDMKKLVAYSSIAHMGFVTAGIFSHNINGINGAVFQMVSHGLISSGLFLCVGFLYNRTGSREIDNYSGLVNSMPVFSAMFIALSMASIGLPSTSGFIGEFLSIVGTFEYSNWMGALLASGVVLGSLYMLWLCKRVIWGGEKAGSAILEDVNYMEAFILLLLVTCVFVLGLYPNLLLHTIKGAVVALVEL